MHSLLRSGTTLAIVAILLLAGCSVRESEEGESRPGPAEPANQDPDVPEPMNPRTGILGTESRIEYEREVEGGIDHLQLETTPVSTWTPYGTRMEGVRLLAHGPWTLEPSSMTFIFDMCMRPMWVHEPNGMRPFMMSAETFDALPPVIFLLAYPDLLEGVSERNLTFGSRSLLFEEVGDSIHATWAGWDEGETSLRNEWKVREPVILSQGNHTPSMGRPSWSTDAHFIEAKTSGEPLGGCEEGPEVPLKNPYIDRFPVTREVMRHDPPMDPVMNDVLDYAREHPSLPILRAFRTAYPDAFIDNWFYQERSWDYTYGAGLQKSTGPTWQFQYWSHDAPTGVWVACMPPDTQDIGLTDYECLEGTYQHQFRVVEKDWANATVSDSAPWLEMALDLMGVDSLPPECIMQYSFPWAYGNVVVPPDMILQFILCPDDVENTTLVVKEPEGIVIRARGETRYALENGVGPEDEGAQPMTQESIVDRPCSSMVVTSSGLIEAIPCPWHS